MTFRLLLKIQKKIKVLENLILKKQKRTEYTDKYVIYLLTTKQNKKDRIYIIGKTTDLQGRLSTYNKTCEHDVVYFKSCGKKDLLNVIENIVLKKLEPYKEVANRDRFILPLDKDIKFFTDIIDNSINFFNDVSDISDSDIDSVSSSSSDGSGIALKKSQVKTKQTTSPNSNSKEKIISKIQKLLDEINAKSDFFK